MGRQLHSLGVRLEQHPARIELRLLILLAILLLI